MIIWEEPLVHNFANAPLVEPDADFIEENFDSNVEPVDMFCERLLDAPGEFALEFVTTLLNGMRDRKVGLYSRFHDLATYNRGYNDEQTIRLGHM